MDSSTRDALHQRNYSSNPGRLLSSTSVGPGSENDSLAEVVTASHTAVPWGIPGSSIVPLPPPAPLLYVGVTLHRPNSIPSWGMSLFLFQHFYLTVGRVRQDLMESFTRFAWVTSSRSVPSLASLRINNNKTQLDHIFRNYPLYPTSCLQIVPGDVILSINGHSVDSFGGIDNITRYLEATTKLDLVAFRHNSSQQCAFHLLNHPTSILTTSSSLLDQDFRAAELAFRTVRPLLMQDDTLARRPGESSASEPPREVPRPHKVTRLVTPEKVAPLQSMEASSLAKRPPPSLSLSSPPPPRKKVKIPHVPRVLPNPWFQDDQGNALLYEDNLEWDVDEGSRAAAFFSPLPTRHFGAWLIERKTAWQTKRRPLQYLSVSLHRPESRPTWGLIVSLLGRSFLGVGHAVVKRQEEHTTWGYMSGETPSKYLLQAYSEEKFRKQAQSQLASVCGSTSELRLQSGDVIISVNGRLLSSFSGLGDVIVYLKQALHLWIVAIRDVSLGHSNTSSVGGQSSEEFGHVAGRAYRSVTARLYGDFRLEHLRNLLVPRKIPVAAPMPLSRSIVPSIHMWRNPLFQDGSGNMLPYEDQFDMDIDYERPPFLPPLAFESFLKQKKSTWQKKWQGRLHLYIQPDDDDESYEEEDSPSVDFWTQQGYPTFQHWLVASTNKWKRTYSWNREKRKQIEEEVKKVVHFPSIGGSKSQLDNWLRVRKNQWRISRRRLQRRRLGAHQVSIVSGAGGENDEAQGTEDKSVAIIGVEQTSDEMLAIDTLLEEQERQTKEATQIQGHFDISFLFDAGLGAPDDVVVHIFSYLQRFEHGKLLCVNAQKSAALRERGTVWRQLCPAHWILPRRPRKPWSTLYITRIRAEEEASRKRSDDLLNKVSDILFKGDHLLKVQNLVNQGEKRFGFNVNYVSGVICERNSMLNLAVINGRPKTVRWLVEEKGADVESCDRGNFTPLMNAAWEGDRYLVRYLLGAGCDRSKVGTGHYTKPLAPPDFKGLTSEGWARKRGHADIAQLIRLGL